MLAAVPRPPELFYKMYVEYRSQTDAAVNQSPPPSQAQWQLTDRPRDDACGHNKNLVGDGILDREF
jgi:hypothetical protein